MLPDEQCKREWEEKMKVTALLTGRGNNTLKDKNILDVLGHPVLYYPAHAARMAKSIDTALAQCFVRDTQLLLPIQPLDFRR